MVVKRGISAWLWPSGTKQLREIFQRNINLTTLHLKHWRAKHLRKLGTTRYSPQHTWRRYIWDKNYSHRKMSCSSSIGFQVYFSELHCHYVNKMNYFTVLSSPAEKAWPYFTIQALVGISELKTMPNGDEAQVFPIYTPYRKGKAASQVSIYWLKRINYFLSTPLSIYIFNNKAH